MTLGETLAAASKSLEEHHIASARLTADVLLAHCMDVDRPFLYAHTDNRLSEKSYKSYQSMIARRIAGEPLQYITGVQEFYGRHFSVDPSVLIPRPETEGVIAAVLEIKPGPDSRIIDIGTGSGCIACTMALELPGGIRIGFGHFPGGPANGSKKRDSAAGASGFRLYGIAWRMVRTF